MPSWQTSAAQRGLAILFFQTWLEGLSPSHHHETQRGGRNADTLSHTLKGSIPFMAPEVDVSRIKREAYMVGFP